MPKRFRQRRSLVPASTTMPARRGLGLPRRAVLRAGAAGLLGGGVVSIAHAASLPAAPPPAAFLPGDPYVETYRQKWALSCEYAATHTALRLLGLDVSEDTMRDLLGQGEDPDETFRGEIQANQNLTDYGVHARGIARLIDLLRAGGHLPGRLQASLLYDFDTIRTALAQGQPVIAWIPLDLRPSSRVAVRLSTGKIVNLVYAEHAVTLRGYDGERVFALDPHDGTTPAYEIDPFLRGMSLFDDPALALGLAPLPPTPTPFPTSEHFPETGITLDGGFYQFYRRMGGRVGLGAPLTPELYEPDVATGADKQVLYTELARMEWYPQTGTFGLGYVGQEYLGEAAAPDPTRRLGSGFGRYVAANGGLRRFGYSV
ncbi:MAG: C39 family peptidase, partial [Chloroflexota bacterium]